MRIHQKRVRSLAAHLPNELVGKRLRVVQDDPTKHHQRLIELGFGEALTDGHSVLPSIHFGPASRRNADGLSVPDRSKPMETVWRPHCWTRSQYRGRDREEVTDVVYVPHRRFPRIEVLPTEVRLGVLRAQDERQVIGTEVFEYGRDDVRLLAAINTCLELFGDCVVVVESAGGFAMPLERRLDWQLLPPGRFPFERLRQQVESTLRGTKPSTLAPAFERLQHVDAFGPSFRAWGKGGFAGYVVFGFEALGLYLLECARLNNATYVFGDDWVELSQLTKAQILAGGLHRERLIHGPDWKRALGQLLGHGRASQPVEQLGARS